MTDNIRSKKSQYKYCNTSKYNLQSILIETIGPSSSMNTPAKRQQIVNRVDDVAVFVNKFFDLDGISCGQLILMERGKYKQYVKYIDSDDFDDDYKISAMSSAQIPDDDDDELMIGEDIELRKEFVDSILYFSVFENHVLVLQSVSLRSRRLENYFNWLFKEKRKDLFEDDENIVLIDTPPKSIYERLVKQPVKSIRIGAPIWSISGEESVANENKVGVIEEKKRTGLLNALKSMTFAENIDTDSITDKANLHVAMEITYKYKTNDAGQNVLDLLAGSMRDAEDSDFSLVLEDGSVIKGSELRVSPWLRCAYKKNGLINEESLFKEFCKWMKEQLPENIEV